MRILLANNERQLVARPRAAYPVSGFSAVSVAAVFVFDLDAVESLEETL